MHFIRRTLQLGTKEYTDIPKYKQITIHNFFFQSLRNSCFSMAFKNSDGLVLTNNYTRTLPLNLKKLL